MSSRVRYIPLWQKQFLLYRERGASTEQAARAANVSLCKLDQARRDDSDFDKECAEFQNEESIRVKF